MKADSDGKEQRAERDAFRRLQAGFADQFRRVFADPLLPRSVVVMPSLSLDETVLARISGVHHYEERMLCLLLLLRMPNTRVVYVSSQPIAQDIIDYYLHLLPGIPHRHASNRLVLLSCHDGSGLPLSQKVLHRPRLIERIREAMGDRASAHMICFNVSPLERTLSVSLGVPVYGCDPDLLHFGSKSGGRKLFREAGVSLPAGFEDLRDAAGTAAALARLKGDNPDLRRAVVKLNEGFSGEGNAIFHFEGAPQRGLERWIAGRLPKLGFESAEMNWEAFSCKIDEMGCVVEELIEGDDIRSPSAQYRVDPLGELTLISTHDQVLGGQGGQVFLGCRFPADTAYRAGLQQEGEKAARLLRDEGVLGRFGIDFVTVRDGAAWRHYAIEINLRKGGTTHPFTMLQYLTDGSFDPDSGIYRTMDGRVRCYFATDNLESPHYRGITPEELIDFSVRNGIHFHGPTQRGVVFHLIGAMSEFGKIGLVAIDETPQAARQLYEETVCLLDGECAGVVPVAG